MATGVADKRDISFWCRAETTWLNVGDWITKRKD